MHPSPKGSPKGLGMKKKSVEIRVERLVLTQGRKVQISSLNRSIVLVDNLEKTALPRTLKGRDPEGTPKGPRRDPEGRIYYCF